MNRNDPVTRLERRAAALLLPALPAVVAMASYSHGHGGLSGPGLGVIVLLAIFAGAAAALGLIRTPRAPLARSEVAPLARMFNGYGA
jgi:hypothetical protein